jgi:DNA-binding transcriptional ArsR family regulator
VADPEGAKKRDSGTRRPAIKRVGTSPASGLPDLDRVIHERVRLGIVSALAANSSMTFADLKRLLGLTDGNLSVHARKLEEAGYVDCVKRFEGRVPKTEYKLTRAGKEALERYLSHLDALIRWSRGAR